MLALFGQLLRAKPPPTTTTDLTTMTLKDQIFSSPVDIPKLLVTKKPEACVDSLFTNFMYHAKQRWSYIASAQAGGADLLSGAATQVPCGGIATALKILIEDKLKLKADYITIPGYIWTKASFLSFDAKVKGNVSRAESPGLFNEGCLFNEHYFVKCGGKYYDPCLNSIYTQENESVRKRYAFTEIISKGSVMAGETTDSVLVFQPNTIVPGWQRGAWLIVKERDVLRYVTQKDDLMFISAKLKTGNLALAARKASRKMFADSNRLQYWISTHLANGVIVT